MDKNDFNFLIDYIDLVIVEVKEKIVQVLDDYHLVKIITNRVKDLTKDYDLFVIYRKLEVKEHVVDVDFNVGVFVDLKRFEVFILVAQDLIANLLNL